MADYPRPYLPRPKHAPPELRRRLASPTVARERAIEAILKAASQLELKGQALSRTAIANRAGSAMSAADAYNPALYRDAAQRRRNRGDYAGAARLEAIADGPVSNAPASNALLVPSAPNPVRDAGTSPAAIDAAASPAIPDANAVCLTPIKAPQP